MASRDRRLQRVTTCASAKLFRTLKSRKTASYQHVIPAGAILIQQQDGFAGQPGSCACSRRLNFHKRDEAVDFRLIRCQLCEDAAKAKRVLAQSGSHPIVSCSCRVALIKDQVENLEHRLEPVGELVAAWHFE